MQKRLQTHLIKQIIMILKMTETIFGLNVLGVV